MLSLLIGQTIICCSSLIGWIINQLLVSSRMINRLLTSNLHGQIEVFALLTGAHSKLTQRVVEVLPAGVVGGRQIMGATHLGAGKI